MDVNTTPDRRWTWAIFGGFALAAVAVAILVAASAWQSGRHSSQLDQAESHSTTAALLQTADEEGQVAAELLRRYVAEGDQTLIPEIQSHSTVGVESLTQAVAQGGVADLDRISVEGAALAEDAGRIVALRLSGDAQGAAAALEEAGPTLEQLAASVQDAIALELDEASSLEASANGADDAAGWLLVAAVTVGAATGLVGVAMIARSLTRRRVPETASPR